MSGFLRSFPRRGRQFGHTVDGPFAQFGEDVIDWRVVRSCRFFQSEDSGVAAADKADFGGEEFLERKAFG
jgi:hypothetical protein